MNELKCPFCHQELEIGGFDDVLRGCPICRNIGTEKLWQELICARRALNVAVDVLKEIDKTRSVANHKIGTQDKSLNSGIAFCWATPDEIHNALVEITAQEQRK